MRDTIRLVANGALIYAIFYALVWVLALKGGLLTDVAWGARDRVPSAVETILLPFAVSAIAAFLAQVGLRLVLKRLRLRLSTTESSASFVFMGLLTVLSLVGGLARLFDLDETFLPTEAAVVVGAWCGVTLRRRVAI